MRPQFRLGAVQHVQELVDARGHAMEARQLGARQRRRQRRDLQVVGPGDGLGGIDHPAAADGDQRPATDVVPHRRSGLRDGLGGDPQGGVTGLGGAEDGPLDAPHDDSAAAAGQVTGVFDLGHGADEGEAIVHAGHEEEAARVLQGFVGGDSGVGRLQGDGDDHARTDHTGGQGEDRIGGGGLVHGRCNSDYTLPIPGSGWAWRVKCG